MAHTSIVDRVLMLAAAVCASALAWQITVLMTSKGHASAPARTAAAITAPAARVDVPPAQTALAAQAAPAQTVRVVYPGPETGEKTSLKASDPPGPSPAPAPMTAPSPAVAPVQTAAVLSQPVPAPLSTPAGPGQASGSPAMLPVSGETDKSEPSSEPTTPPASASASIDLASAEQPAPADHPDAATPAAPDGALDLNHASVESLNHLKGVGRIGQAIVSHRPYRSVEDLVKKRVVRRDVYQQIRQQVVTQ